MGDNVSSHVLKIKVKRGVNLAVRDFRSSDPYVIICLGQTKLKTRVVKNTLNPEWNDKLVLRVRDPEHHVNLMVYDKDTFSCDDKMGDSEFDIKMFLETVKMNLEGVSSGTIITSVRPGRHNCLVEDSHIKWVKGKVVQNMCLRLRNVESGEVELELHCRPQPHTAKFTHA